MKQLIDKIGALNTKDDFVSFVGLLINDLKNNVNEWENKSLESYLEAIASWTEDMDGYYQNNNLPAPENINWRPLLIFCSQPKCMNSTRLGAGMFWRWASRIRGHRRTSL